MTDSPLIIDKITRRRFILGQQGLYPGRRYRGQAGAAEAMQAGAVVQMDPLNVIARSHDLALFGRVLDYSPKILDNLQFSERQFFDYGGTVFVHPMDELPHWRTVMRRKAQEPRRQKFVAEYQAVVAEVFQAITENGPLAGRMDARLQRAAGEFHLLGLWVEPGEVVDEAYRTALAAGLRRLMRMVGAERLVCEAGVPPELAGELEERCND
ncbi:MAG TPA: crosslink repair DNA glycosylase YcaQ family protein [Anaerolineales bacterium]|nr:crosslink repair DNA glycosylase YcaQ family protein [Anaerolineales bacterium]